MTTVCPPEPAAGPWPVVLCKAASCRARIILATSAMTGARCPVDEHPGPGGTVELRADRRGLPVAVVLPRRETIARTDLHISHFVTCTDPGRFRRRGSR